MGRVYSQTYKVVYACVSMLSMFVGAQVVHQFYKPLAPLDEEVKRQKELILAERAASKSASSSVNAQ